MSFKRISGDLKWVSILNETGSGKPHLKGCMVDSIAEETVQLSVGSLERLRTQKCWVYKDSEMWG